MRVVIADDTALLRQGLARLLTEAGIEVCGESGDAERLLELVEAESPDVAVIDIRMPPTHTDEGLVAAAAIRERRPAVGVLVLSQYVDASYALRLLEGTEGSCGYLLKDSSIQDLISGIESAARGVPSDSRMDDLREVTGSGVSWLQTCHHGPVGSA